MKLPYAPEILLLDIYLEKIVIRKDKWTPMFTVALFTIAKTWKQLKCPLTKEWIKKIWYVLPYTYVYIHVYTYIHTQWNISHLKEWNNAICSNMDGLRDSHSKWSKQKKTDTIWSSNPTSGHLSRENPKLKRYMRPYVHCSTIYNSQDMEAT